MWGASLWGWSAGLKLGDVHPALTWLLGGAIAEVVWLLRSGDEHPKRSWFLTGLVYTFCGTGLELALSTFAHLAWPGLFSAVAPSVRKTLFSTAVLVFAVRLANRKREIDGTNVS